MAFNHKFKPEDMSEIRQLRSVYLKCFKLNEKCDRVDKISKAILPDIKWSKLSLGRDTVDENTLDLMDTLDSKILSFREEIAQSLEEIFDTESDQLGVRAYVGASTDEIRIAASDMATKYHKRSTKSRKISKHKSKNTSSNSPLKAQAVAKTTSKFQAKSPSTDKLANQLDVSKSTTESTSDNMETNTWTVVRDKRKTRRKSTRQTQESHECQAGPSSTHQTTIKSFFKTTKSSTNLQLSTPSKFDFFAGSVKPPVFGFS